MRSWNLNSGIFRVFAWTKDFVSSSMKLTKAQCWVRIRGHSMEYWQPKPIFSIAGEISTHLSLDNCTMNKSRDFFRKVLVDIDMIFALPYQILVEKPYFAFITNIEFEKVPPFCSPCKNYKI